MCEAHGGLDGRHQTFTCVGRADMFPADFVLHRVQYYRPAATALFPEESCEV
jgi:hypothetical protein